MRPVLLAVVIVPAVAALAGVVSLRGDGESAPAAMTCSGSQPSYPEPRLDRRRDAGRSAAFLRDYDPEALSFALPPDSIRALDRPCHESPAEAAALLPGSSLVLGVERDGETRAYPVDLVALHEVVNDVVGGDPVAVTWCPLCATALAFDRRIDGRALTFGVSGFLHKANLVMFDRETGSLWSQLLAGAVTGRMRGRLLERIPVVQTTWGDWKRAHPQTRVLSIRRDPLGVRFTMPGGNPTGVGVEDTNAPYGAYASKVPVYFPRVVRGIPDATLILGVSLSGRQKAWPLPQVNAAGMVQDRLAGVPVAIVAAPNANAAYAYSRRLDSRVLDLELRGSTLVDRATRSGFSILTGRGVGGPLEGETLARIPATTAYWFAWRRAYPRTSVSRVTRR